MGYSLCDLRSDRRSYRALQQAHSLLIKLSKTGANYILDFLSFVRVSLGMNTIDARTID